MPFRKVYWRLSRSTKTSAWEHFGWRIRNRIRRNAPMLEYVHLSHHGWVLQFFFFFVPFM
jgi:hypothetical protein